VPVPLRDAMVRRGQPKPLEETLCQRLMDGRLPQVISNLPAIRATQELPDQGFPIGSYLGAPVLRADGSLYGALCCLTLKPNSRFGELEHKRLQMVAQLMARLLHQSHP
jgi:GAF domain-containing protein